MRQTCNRVPGGFHLGPGHTFPAFLQTCNRVPDRTKRVTGRPNSIFIWDPATRFRGPFLALPPGCTFRVAHPTWDPVTRFVRFFARSKTCNRLPDHEKRVAGCLVACRMWDPVQCFGGGVRRALFTARKKKLISAHRGPGNTFAKNGKRVTGSQMDVA